MAPRRIDAEALMTKVVSEQDVRSGRRIYLRTPWGPREATREETFALRNLIQRRDRSASTVAVVLGAAVVLAPALLGLAML